jgi:WXG100 family type VII secretion target
MAQIDVDSQKLRDFSSELKRFRREMEHRMRELSTKLGKLSDTWQDAQYEKFRDSFKRTQSAMNPFYNEVDRIAPKLDKDADIIEEYDRS